MTTPPRLRFAPSPTGYLHVGGARTALFNWLYARKVGGTFLLRVEDTDKARSSDEHTQVILDGLKWLGLDWDEEVVFQGARVERHREMADKLLADGKAYTEEGAIRIRMPQEEIAWDDFVHGRISFQGADLKDWVILRSDRTPTYNFAVVVDDIDMHITHVMRGDDHVSNTPKQIAVYRAFDLPQPAFGHVPNVNGMDGKKLSKRHGATAVGEYAAMGFLPVAMRNFLALLGWSPGGDRELFFDVKEMIEAFSLDGIQSKSAAFDVKKLEWMNGQHLTRLDPETLLPVIQPLLASKGLDVAKLDRSSASGPGPRSKSRARWRCASTRASPSTIPRPPTRSPRIPPPSARPRTRPQRSWPVSQMNNGSPRTSKPSSAPSRKHRALQPAKSFSRSGSRSPAAPYRNRCTTCCGWWVRKKRSGDCGPPQRRKIGTARPPRVISLKG